MTDISPDGEALPPLPELPMPDGWTVSSERLAVAQQGWSAASMEEYARAYGAACARAVLAAPQNTPGDVAVPPVEAPAFSAVPAALLDRIESALQRHLDKHAPKRIPADVNDSDLVLHDLRQWRKGEKPGWWNK